MTPTPTVARSRTSTTTTTDDADDEDDADVADDDAAMTRTTTLTPARRASWSSTRTGLDQPRRRRAGPPAGRHPQGRSRRHARSDGHRGPRPRASGRAPGCSPTWSAPTRPTGRRSGSARTPSPTTPRASVVGGRRCRRARRRPTSPRGRRRAHRADPAAAERGERDQGRRPALVRAGARGGGGRAGGPAGDGAPVRRCSTSGAAAADGRAVLDLDVEVEVSSGTYVRALARDLGAALGVGGHLTALAAYPGRAVRPRRGPHPGAAGGRLRLRAARRGGPLDLRRPASSTEDEVRALRFGQRLAPGGTGRDPGRRLRPGR